MNALLEKMKIDMELRGFSDKTVSVYLKNVNYVSTFSDTPPELLTYDQVREFLHHAITVRKLSRSYVNAVYSAIKFFFSVTLNLKWDMKDIPRVKQATKLPVVLTPNQIRKLLDSVTNIKHRTMLITCYSAGLRVGEMLNLKVCDIDSTTMRIRVRNGKGNKERYTILSKQNLEALRAYYKLYTPTGYLFYNPTTLKPLSARTIQIVFSTSRDSLGLPENATIHSLRHSFATHLLTSGTNIIAIKELLGHAHIDTTAIYLHLTSVDLAKVVSPLDNLEGFHVQHSKGL